MTDELLEVLAALEHEQWMEWTKDIAKDIDILLDIANTACIHNYTSKDEDITAYEMSERLERWKTLWVPYEELSEDLKDEDRYFARKVLKAIGDGE